MSTQLILLAVDQLSNLFSGLIVSYSTDAARGWTMMDQFRYVSFLYQVV